MVMATMMVVVVHSRVLGMYVICPITIPFIFVPDARRWGLSTSTHSSKPLDVYFEVLPDATASLTSSNTHDNATSHEQQQQQQVHNQDLPPVAAFFVERYCLYHRLPFRSGVWRGRIAHAPWDLSPGGARLLHTVGTGQLMESACPGLRPVLPAFGGNAATYEAGGTSSNNITDATKEKSGSVAGIWDAVAPPHVHFGSVNSRQIYFRMFEAVRSSGAHQSCCSRNAAMTRPMSNVCSDADDGKIP